MRSSRYTASIFVPSQQRKNTKRFEIGSICDHTRWRLPQKTRINYLILVESSIWVLCRQGRFLCQEGLESYGLPVFGCLVVGRFRIGYDLGMISNLLHCFCWLLIFPCSLEICTSSMLNRCSEEKPSGRKDVT